MFMDQSSDPPFRNVLVYAQSPLPVTSSPRSHGISGEPQLRNDQSLLQTPIHSEDRGLRRPCRS